MSPCINLLPNKDCNKYEMRSTCEDFEINNFESIPAAQFLNFKPEVLFSIMT
jgi:hypothetical protein